jgi:DNA primase
MSTRWVDFKRIKAEVGIAEVLEHYGLMANLKKSKRDNLVGTCPLHNGTNPTQFHVSLAKNAFHCFGDCHGGGNVIDFVAKMEGGISIRAAGLRLQEWFGIEPERSQKKGKEEKQTENRVKEKEKEQDAGGQGEQTRKLAKEKKEGEGDLINKPLTFQLKNLDQEHPYLAERGLNAETIAEFGLGYCKKGLMAGRIAIPIHNEKGELVAYVGRWPGDPPEGEGKYKLPPGFHKSLVVFNLHWAKDHAEKQGLVLVEGFFDCLKLWQAGVEHVAALMGSSMSEEQEALIGETVGPQGKVALMFDEDEAGWRGREDALNRLATQVYVKVIGLGEEGRQPDSLTEEEIREKLGL